MLFRSKYGEVQIPKEGIEARTIDSNLLSTLCEYGYNVCELDENLKGIVVLEVESGSPSDKSGVIPGDIILSINEKPVRSNGEYISWLYNYRPGENITLNILRENQEVEISMNLGIDPRHADQMVRGVVSLPNGNGKSMKVAVFAKDKKAEEAKVAGADVVGAEDLADDMQKGNLNYDRIVATPDMMGIVGRIGKILGPKGLMPNPKLGTVTTDVKAAVEAAKSGQIQYRAEKTGIVQAGIGKISFGSDKLIDNVKSFIESIQKAKPSGAKGTFIKKISISSTMGVGININI